ncbi:hypothetical protein C0995_005013 [Termitomyces sp. Mi166|nr:hypothetical protein C0995_005013 [Termitomyces sp. Mi166\
MPSTKKRAALSADDLLRRLEEPRAKRARVSIPVDDEDDSDDNSGNGVLRQEGEDGTTDEEDEEDEADGESPVENEEDDEEDDEDTDDVPVRLVEDFAAHDRFGSSLVNRTRDLPKSTPQSQQSKDVSFSSLGISALLQSALTSMSIRTPTPVQAACISPLLAGRDCIGNAKTGSGKTIAFALPILQKLSVDPYGIFALVLTPTRLVSASFDLIVQLLMILLGAPLNVRTAVVVGGMDMMAQALELGNRPHVVIATPGRIVDHLRSSSGEWNLSRVKFLVLDEADRLLTPTFSDELAHLFKALPRDRQTCLFTATLTPSIEALANAPPRSGKQKPFIYRMTETVETVDTLQQNYLLVPSHVREAYLYHLLCNPPESVVHMRRAPAEPEKGCRLKGRRKEKKRSANDEDEAPEQPPPTIIFCARARTVAYLTSLLKSLSIRSTGLHSRLTQRERLTSLSLFRASVVPVLVSTDVGGRGLDIEEVAMVINWDVPQEAEEYTHRVGRTARAGRGGVAVSFVTEHDEERVLKIEERIKTKLAEMTMSEEKVLSKLNKVSTAKRVARMVGLFPLLQGRHAEGSPGTTRLWVREAGGGAPGEDSDGHHMDPVASPDWGSVLQYVADDDVPASQIPTPPLSNDGTPVLTDDDHPLVSVSTTFHPAAQLHSTLPDTVLLSSDAVFFYVHAHRLLQASANAFHSLLPAQRKEPGPVIDVPESSAVLNIILHVIYDLSCAHYSPSFSQLVSAVKRLSFFGIDPKLTIIPNTHIYTLILSHAPLCPLELYTLAANYDLYDLAVAISSHLLSFPLSSLTDEMAQAIGPVYLKRLFFLHFGRLDALKRILLPPPHPHPPTPSCDFSSQKKLTRAWALASAYLAWDAQPDLSTAAMESALRSLEERLGCEDCKAALQARIRTLVVQWAMVKVRYLVQNILTSFKTA